MLSTRTWTRTTQRHGKMTNCSLEEIRRIGEILSTDYNLSLSGNYLEYLDILLFKGLNNLDPILRFQAILSLRLLSDNIFNRLGHMHKHKHMHLNNHLNLHVALIPKTLVNLISSEENVQIRTMACVCLGSCLASINSATATATANSMDMHSCFSPKDRRLAFKVILIEFFKFFPANTRKFKDPGLFDLRSNISKVKFDSRIQFIFALSLCLGLPEARSEYFQRYTDELFLAILKSNSHALLISAVLEALAKHLPKTNRNRIRIETLYRKPIDNLILIHQLEAESAKPAISHLISSLNLFMSVWAPIPTDKSILFAQSLSGENLELNGYASKRYNHLKETDEGDTLFEDLNQQEKLDVVKRMQVDPYSASVPKYFEFCVSLFADIMEVDGGDKIADSVAVSTEPAQHGRKSVSKMAAEEEEDVESIYVPLKESLTFKVANNLVEFHHSFRFQKLFLENTTSEDQPFTIQVSLPAFFSVSPSYGTVPKLTTIPIKISFNRNLLKQPGHVKGYLFVRSRLGFPMERLSLSGYNLPAIKVSSTILDFGTCPSTESRTATFSLTNVLPVDCTVVMILSPGENSMRFILPQAQVVVPAHDVKHVTLKASFMKEGPVEEILILVACGIQIVKMKLKAYCGKSVKVLEEALNFGHTDIFFEPVSKNITLVNLSKEYPVMVSHSASSTEILVNEGREIVLEPGATVPVPVRFTSVYSGKRVEKLGFYAPNSGGQKVVTVNAMSGPYLKVPIHEDIYMTPCCVGDTTFVRVPVTNLQSEIAFFNIAIPTDFPVKMVSCLFLFSNSVENRAAELYQSKEFAGAGWVGLKVGVPSLSTSVIEIAFTGIKEGLFKIPLKISMLFPKKFDISSFHIYVFIFNEELLLKYFNVDKALKDFFLRPYMLPPSLSHVFDNAQVAADAKEVRTDVFRMEPPFQTVYGSTGSGRLATTLDYVNLINMTSEPQGYRIMLSNHFKTIIGLEGILPPASILEIPIRFNPKFLTNQETVGFSALGCITVLNSNANFPSVASSQLLGVIEELLALEVRDDSQQIKFPNTALNESTKRQLLIRNKSTVPLHVEFRVANIRDERQSSAHIADTFTLSSPKPVTLKAFEMYSVEIVFKGNTQGEYRADFSISYSLAAAETAVKVSNKKVIGPIALFGSIGAPEISRQPEFLSFGDVPISESVQQSVILQNNSAVSTTLHILPPSQLCLGAGGIEVVKSKGKIEIPFVFRPGQNMQFQSQLAFAYGSTTLSIPVLGSSGVFRITSNVGTPVVIDNSAPVLHPADSAIFDVGNISFGDTKKQVLSLINDGSLDAFITKISSQNESLISLEPIYPHFVGSIGNALLSAFGTGSMLENEEIDLDNFVYLMEHSTKVVANRTRTGQFYKRRASSILSYNKAVSKLFADSKVPEYQAELAVFGAYPLSESLPCRLRPLQALELTVKVNADALGEFIVPILMRLTRFRGNPSTLALWIKGKILRPLTLETKKIDFGTVHVAEKKYSNIVFTNEELFPIEWSLEYISTKLVAGENIEDGYKPYLNQPRCPVDIFPTSGTLVAGGTQTIDLYFSASIPQAESYTLIQLKSGDYNVQDVLVQAIGGTGNLSIDTDYFDYGTLRVGSSETRTMTIRNSGLLSCSFFLENLNPNFSAEPELGEVAGGDEVQVELTFKPSKPIHSAGMMRLHTIPKLLAPPLDIKLLGMGGYPKLTTVAKVIDFGTALYMAVNRRRIEVLNIGAAEAIVNFECGHPDISIDMSTTNALQVAPGQTKNITIIYHPRNVEMLNVKAYIKSSDNRGETFTLNIKGDVGIPKLTLNPPNALQSLDFGVMRLNKPYKKSFTIVNDGTIFLSFKTSIESIFITDISDSEKNGRQITNVLCPVTISPMEGKLGLGEAIAIQIFFVPTILAEYEYEFKLSYEYQHFSGTIKGVGGRSTPKILSPFENFDFELCRLGRIYEKTIQIYNSGNLGFYYYIRPAPTNGDYSIYSNEMRLIDDGGESTHPFLENLDLSAEKWYQELKAIGVTLFKADGYCGPQSKMEITVQFKPEKEVAIKQEFLFIHDEKFDMFSISGLSSTAKLYIFDPHTKLKIDNTKTPDIKIGVHPVNVTHRYNLDLVNPGPFGVDFLLQPMSSMEYEIFPLRGYIEPKSTIPISIAFRPSSESKFFSNLRVLWEGESIKANVYGDGGIGRLEIKFLEERDIMLKSLDFGMVPFNTPCRKRFFISNYGMVGVNAFLETENEDYAISIMGDLLPIKEIGVYKPTRDTFSTWDTALKLALPPNKSIQIAVRYLPRNSTTSVGNITIRSDSGNFAVPLKGKGGTIALGHKGDLEFGDISCNYIYTRKIVISNGGSIAANVTGSWAVVGYASENPESSMDLAENYSALDPRSQWARNQYCLKLGLDSSSQLSAKDYWNLIYMMIYKEAPFMTNNRPADESTSQFRNDSTENTHLPLGKRNVVSGSSNHFKRRQMFYFLITSNQLSSQSALKITPFIRVTPSVLSLPSYGEATFTVELNLGSEDTFLATLVVKPDIPNSAKYEIPLTATPKMVSIFCDDTRILDFYRQPIGETESITRKFSNVGHKDVPFKLVNTNPSLSIFPLKGILKIGQSVIVTFSFSPVDESVQTNLVTFEPLFSDPIRFKMYGGGGYAKASLSRYRRFDFGHCMIGKDTISFLPIVNEGNALLHLVKFDLVETNTFYKGQDWPSGRISLFPGKSYNLPLVFNPHEENPMPGSLNIGTVSESFEIELIGLGREAVLIVSKVALEFSECLIGNTYEQKVGLKNIGDVNYPVNCHLEKEFPDITFFPSTLTINPFSENFVTITYKPSQQTKTTITMTLQSPYSTHKVPIMVHAGIAFLEFASETLDFGMFERTTKPSITMTMKNSGTVKTNFYIKDAVKPSIFVIEPHKGVLHPKKMVDIKISHIKHEVSHFEENIIIRTDLLDKIYNISVSGRCEETVLHENEFSLLNLGVCPVLEATTKAIQFKNYGKFPLRFRMQSAYPLKVSPNEGEVAGGEVGSVFVTWSPSGGYELRTQLSMFTNIGKFQIFVRGKSMFPEISVSTNTLDFGVCAVGFGYDQHFILENKGKVKLNYNIPLCKELSYVASFSQGTLDAKETKRIDVLFTPRAPGKLPGSLIVDVKGIHYKEILMAGIGGAMEMNIDPLAIDLERCPFGMKLYESIKITNDGDVTLFVDFSETNIEQGSCTIDIPQPQIVYPHQSLSVPIGFTVFIVDRFYAKIVMTTKEQEIVIPVTGVGIKISLSNRSKEILCKESLSSLKILDPFTVDSDYLPVEYSIKKQYERHRLSMQIYDLFSVIFAQELAQKERKMEEREMQSVTQRRKSFVSFVNIKELSPEFQEAAGFSREASEMSRASLSVPSSSDHRPIITGPSDTGPQQLTHRPSALGKPQLPSIGSLESSLEALGASEQPNVKVIEDFSPVEENTRGEMIYVPDIGLNDVLSSSSDFALPATLEHDVSITSLVEKEKELQKQDSSDEEEEIEPTQRDAPRPKGQSSKDLQTFKNSCKGYDSLITAINGIFNPFSEVDYGEVQRLADTFIRTKMDTSLEERISLDADPVIYSVIHHSDLQIRDIDLEPVLYYENNAFDPIDLDFITCRPAPFKKDDSEEKMKHKFQVKSLESRKGYLTSFPKLDRRQRNARTNPLGII